ncbi:MAG: PAS-domain containing protein [Pseudomonadota bacterium]
MASMDVSLAWMPLAVLASAALSTLVLWVITRFRRVGPDCSRRDDATRSVFLIKDNKIIDRSSASAGGRGLKTWIDLRAWFGERFGDVPRGLDDIPTGETRAFSACSEEDDAVLTIRSTPLGQSVTLEDTAGLSAFERHDLLSKGQDAQSFQNILQKAPAIVFAMTDEGTFKWGNVGFDQLSIEDRRAFVQSVKDRGDQNTLQLCLADTSKPCRQHFELSVLREDADVVTYATDITRLIEADTVRKEFVQTLTKTFADLSTGLAVFDRDQRLVLFNPAVLDLTGLSAEFLSGRPPMIEVFDRLRDNHKMPEPKNYTTWRAQIAEMIKSATKGYYSESWSLPGGLTYKLTGRPHPNGAIAFLIEDITDEMTMTRQSRSQVETHQAILDAMTNAIAVIGPDGGLLISNAAFADVVGFDPDASFTPTSFKDVLKACERRFPGNDVWDDLSEFGLTKPVDVHLRDGPDRRANLRAETLPDGLFILNLSVAPSTVPVSA